MNIRLRGEIIVVISDNEASTSPAIRPPRYSSGPNKAWLAFFALGELRRKEPNIPGRLIERYILQLRLSRFVIDVVRMHVDDEADAAQVNPTYNLEIYKLRSRKEIDPDDLETMRPKRWLSSRKLHIPESVDSNAQLSVALVHARSIVQLCVNGELRPDDTRTASWQDLVDS